jgi:nicotinate-nucleotide pyrophosphorylase (carboxylating)
MFIPRKLVEERLKLMLAEDIGQGDITSAAIVPQGVTVLAAVIAKESGIAAGIEEAKILAETVGLQVKSTVSDGEQVKNNQVLMQITGDAQTILTIERTLLNLLSRMCGIATTTHKMMELLRKAKSKAKIAATRKSAPGMLFFDKKAVMLGGGDPHRLHLDDMILIKDNHIAIVGDAEEAVELAKEKVSFTKKIEVEITKPSDAVKVAEAGADIIMLDNFSPEEVDEAVKRLKDAGLYKNVLLEISGGIDSETLLDYALAKVNIISMGELTHSAKSLDISLEIIKK